MQRKVTGRKKIYIKRITDRINFLEILIERNVIGGKPISYQIEEIEALLWLMATYEIYSGIDLRPSLKNLSIESRKEYDKIKEGVSSSELN